MTIQKFRMDHVRLRKNNGKAEKKDDHTKLRKKIDTPYPKVEEPQTQSLSERDVCKAHNKHHCIK